MPKVLIVDDDPEMRFAIRSVLSADGYETAEAETVAAACEKLSTPYDIIFLDAGLPELRSVQDRKGRGALVMITGFDRVSTENVHGPGAAAWLRKPFGNEELLEVASKVLKLDRPKSPVTEVADKGGFPRAAGLVAKLLDASWKKILLFALLPVIILGAVYWRTLFYFKAYPAESANISALFWDGDTLWAGDWVSQTVYRYIFSGGKLVLEKRFQLEGVHISGLAAAGGVIYIADAWRKVVEERRDEDMGFVRNFSFPGKITSLAFDGERLLSCGENGIIMAHELDDKLSVAMSFNMVERPDIIYRSHEAVWSVVSSSGKIYKHSAGDMSVLKGYLLRPPFSGKPLSAMAWRGGRLWLAMDGTSEIYELGKGRLKQID